MLASKLGESVSLIPLRMNLIYMTLNSFWFGFMIAIVQSFAVLFGKAFSHGKKEHRQLVERMAQHIETVQAQVDAWVADTTSSKPLPILQRGLVIGS